MKILLNKYTMAFAIFGMLFILIPGFVLYLLGHETLGKIMIFWYTFPLGIWAVAMLIYIAIDFIRDWNEPFL